MSNFLFSSQFKKALAAGKNRDYKTAVKILEAVILSAPDSFFSTGSIEAAQTYLYLGRSWHCLNVPSKAFYYFKLYTSILPDDYTGWFFLARTCFISGRYMQSFRYVRKSLMLNPQDIQSLQLLGAVNLKLKRSTHARVAFEKGLELDPDNEAMQRGYNNALFIDAVKQLRAGESDTARQMFTFLINNGIDGVVPRLYLGHAFRDLQALPQALSQYEAACQFAPDDPSLPWYAVSTLFQMGKQEKALAYLQQLQVPESLQRITAGQQVSWSETLVDKMIIQQDLLSGEFSRAAQAARLFIRKNGSDPVVHCLLGEALRNSGSYNPAINHFMRAIELDKTNPAPRYGLLIVLIDKQDWESLDRELTRCMSPSAGEQIRTDPALLYYRCIADAKLKKAPEAILSRVQALLHSSPGDPKLMLVLAEQYVRIGMPELAVNWYKKVRDKIPDNEEAAIGYLAACEADNSRSTAERTDAYTYYLGRWGDNAVIRHEYITWLTEYGNWAAAADNIELLLSNHSCEKSNCTVKITRRNLAHYRRKAGQFRQAAILYRDILRCSPKDVSALYNLLYCLDKIGSPDKARELLQAAAKFISLDLELLLVLGILLTHEGETEKALDIFRKATNTYPNDWRAWHHIAEVYRVEGIHEMAMQFEQEAATRKNIPPKTRQTAAGQTGGRR